MDAAVQAAETEGLDARLDAIADLVEAHVDLAAIRVLASDVHQPASPGGAPALPPPGSRIAIARDAAFSFLYPHVLAGWREAGAH